MQSLARSRRAILRRGDPLPQPGSTGPQKGILISVPLFHVIGLAALMVRSKLPFFCHNK